MTHPKKIGHDTSVDELVEALLERDADVHAAAIDELADRGDKRVIPHLIELLMIDSIGNNWAEFGFPEVLRDRAPPRYLELPDVRWPGVLDALQQIAGPDFDSDYAWVEWETWYSQQDIDPLAGFDDWKLHLYNSYLPPVGGLLDQTPRDFDLQEIRWGNCDRSFLAALNAPDFVAGNEADAAGDTDDSGRSLRDDDLVFGFEIDGTAYAVPRWVLFPHELMNATIEGVPVSLTYCTLCNAPILYDRRIGGDTYTFGSSGMLLDGNKVMYDEETESLWRQHRGTPIAGEHLDADSQLDVLPITQTDWAEWRDKHPETRALNVDTGYDYDYHFYRDGLGIFRHYWGDEDAVQPGVTTADEELSEKEDVYGVTSQEDSEIYVFPVDDATSTPLTATIDGRDVVAIEGPTGDVGVYEAPSIPVEQDGGQLRDAAGTQWTVTRDALVSDNRRLTRVAGRHGLWFAFRSQYDEYTVVQHDE